MKIEVAVEPNYPSTKTLTSPEVIYLDSSISSNGVTDYRNS